MTRGPRTNNRQANLFRVRQLPDEAGNGQCTIFIKTIKDKYEFNLAFTIPYQSPQHLTKPARFLAHFIAHEGSGSVFSYLKNRGWLLSVSAGPQTWNRGVQIFAISGRLTLLGYCMYSSLSLWTPDFTIIAGNYREVVRTIFSYISLLRTSTPSFPPYFGELKELSEIFFHNREKSQPHSYVISLTGKLEEDWPAQWLLNADSLYREYSEVAVKVVLDCVLPERARLTLSAKTHENLVETRGIDWQKEKWYGSEYSAQKSGILGKVRSPVILGDADRSLKCLAGDHSRIAPATPQPLHTEEFRGGPGWCFHGKPCTLRKFYKVTVAHFLDPSIPGMYFGVGFVAPLVQTGQCVLGSKGPRVHRPEIVSHRILSDEPRLPAEGFTHSPLTEATTRHALLTRHSYF